MRSAPRPVSTPPVEVARRYPWRVVMNSCTAWRCGARRVGKICRYHGLIMMARQIASELVGEILGIADGEDLGRGVVPETPGRKGDRGQQGFQMAGRQIDDQ